MSVSTHGLYISGQHLFLEGLVLMAEWLKLLGIRSVGGREEVESGVGRVCLGICVDGVLMPCALSDVEDVEKGLAVGAESLGGIPCGEARGVDVESVLKDFMVMTAAIHIALKDFEGFELSEFNPDIATLTVSFNLRFPDGYERTAELAATPARGGLKWWVVRNGNLAAVLDPFRGVADAISKALKALRILSTPID